jgi:N-acylmannosamine kinase
MPHDAQVIAVDIGGTKLAVAKVRAGTIEDRREMPTPAKQGPIEVVRAILESMNDWTNGVAHMGIAATGLVNDGCVTALNQVTLPAWHTFPLQEVLTKETGLKVKIVNDAQAAAWGESRFGAGRNLASLFFITVSTGVGGGMVIERRLIEGAVGLAGHIGHSVSNPEGPVCGCGRRGCLEQMTAGQAIEREARRLKGRHYSAKEVFVLASQGEVWAEQILTVSARYLAVALADIKVLFDPQAIILGGGIGLGTQYLARVQEALQGVPQLFIPRILPAELGADAGLIGAADLAVIPY